MARQYFNAQQVDSLVVAASITPTTTRTVLFSVTQAPLYFPIGNGASAPSAGQVFRFAMGGLITTPTTGTLIIDPLMGLTTAGTSMGVSPAQTVPSTALTNAAWRLEGDLIFRSISPTATTSTVWCCGTFSSQGVLATAGSAFVIPFSSAAAVSVDTTGTGSANTFGALNFAFTFSVTGATISAQYTSFQSLN
jgi:hypothetical protein